MNRARLWTMIRKEFVQMRRDKATLRLVLVVPVLQLVIFGYAIHTDVRNLPTTVFDQSRTQESRSWCSGWSRRATSWSRSRHGTTPMPCAGSTAAPLERPW